MAGLLMLTKTRKNKNDDDNDNDNNRSDKMCADDDVDALKPSFCPHLTEATRQASSQRERGQQREIDLHPTCFSVFDNDNNSICIIMMKMIITIMTKTITVT